MNKLDKNEFDRLMLAALSVICNTTINIKEGRNICLNLINTCVKEAQKQCEEDNHYDLFKPRVSDMLSHILYNANPLNNPDSKLFIDLKNTNITADDVINMNASELNPEVSKDMLLEINRRLSSKIDKKFMKGKLCKFCREEKVSYFEKQTRSLDEPKTIFYECNNCNNTWT
jgi:transcription elongation factor S-II